MIKADVFKHLLLHMLPPPINHFLIECFFVNSITFNLTVFKEFLECFRGFRIIATCYNRHQDLIAFAIFFTVAINCKWIFIFGLYIFCPQWNSLIRSMNLYTIHRLKSTIGFLQSSFRSVLDFMCSCRYDYWRMHVLPPAIRLKRWCDNIHIVTKRLKYYVTLYSFCQCFFIIWNILL